MTIQQQIDQLQQKYEAQIRGADYILQQLAVKTAEIEKLYMAIADHQASNAQCVEALISLTANLKAEYAERLNDGEE